MPRFFTSWASVLLLMSAAIKDMADRIEPVAPPPTDSARQITIHAGQTQGLAYQLQVTGCVDSTRREIVETSHLPMTVITDNDQPCRIDARRLDGDLWTPWTHDIAIDSLVLDLPVERWAGLGVSFNPRPDGALVRDVYKGLPGGDMGLEDGDIIATVNGRSLANRTDEEMIEIITGPEGTRVDLGIIDVRTGNLLHRSTRREYIDVNRR